MFLSNLWNGLRIVMMIGLCILAGFLGLALMITLWPLTILIAVVTLIVAIIATIRKVDLSDYV